MAKDPIDWVLSDMDWQEHALVRIQAEEKTKLAARYQAVAQWPVAAWGSTPSPPPLTRKQRRAGKQKPVMALKKPTDDFIDHLLELKSEKKDEQKAPAAGSAVHEERSDEHDFDGDPY